MIWNVNLFPPGGFVFTDADRLVHTAAGLELLISTVAEYRVRRGLPPGNPTAEVNAQLCKQFPSRCLSGSPPSDKVLQTSRAMALASRVSQWLSSVWRLVAKKEQGFVEAEEVKRRVKICKDCPKRSDLPTDCAACSESVNHLSFQLRAGRDKHSKRLRACSEFGTDLRLDCILKQPKQDAGPDFCWKRTL